MFTNALVRLNTFFINTVCSGFFLVMTVAAHAENVVYTLDGLILDDGTTITGTFSWVYDLDDFENGVGQFVSLEVPHTLHDQNDLEATFDMGSSIEITFPGNLHDDGVDITFFLSQPLTPTTSAPLDLNESRYEIGGNGFHTGFFLSGSITPVVDDDGDSIANGNDNCLLAANNDQRDTDNDGFGNVCDPDLNNDGIVNFSDLSLWVPFFNSATSGDADFNGDGVANFADYAVFPGFFLNAPGPSGVAL